MIDLLSGSGKCGRIFKALCGSFEVLKGHFMLSSVKKKLLKRLRPFFKENPWKDNKFCHFQEIGRVWGTWKPLKTFEAPGEPFWRLSESSLFKTTSSYFLTQKLQAKALNSYDSHNSNAKLKIGAHFIVKFTKPLQRSILLQKTQRNWRVEQFFLVQIEQKHPFWVSRRFRALFDRFSQGRDI